MIQTPSWYEAWYLTLPSTAIDFGVGGIELFRPDEVPIGQEGYAVAPSAASPSEGVPGGWQSDWVVIGHETTCGDPIIVVTTSPHPVFTAAHGQGEWSLEPIAPSLDELRECLFVFAQIAEGRANPGDLETNPPTLAEQKSFVRAIKRITRGDSDSWLFWAVLIELDTSRIEEFAAEFESGQT